MDTIGDVIHTVAPLAPLLLAAGKKPRAKKTAGGVTGGDLSMLHYKELKGQPALTAPAEKRKKQCLQTRYRDKHDELPKPICPAHTLLEQNQHVSQMLEMNWLKRL